jgi:hypothetical protein
LSIRVGLSAIVAAIAPQRRRKRDDQQGKPD